MNANVRILSLGLFSMMSAAAQAGPVGPLTSFTANTTAKASEVNGNFSAVKTAVDDNDSRISALQAALAVAQGQIAALQVLLAGVSRETVNGQPTVRFSGVNVQVVSGAGTTDTVPPNGRGNLIIGYDEARAGSVFFCSIGAEANGTPIPPSTSPTPPAACTDAGGTWAVSHKSGSHYLVVGYQNNYSQFGGIVAGRLNTSNNAFASVSGGINNKAGGQDASVSGGAGNTASGNSASVSGGANNTASAGQASVSGGLENLASGLSASVSGGSLNIASGQNSSVSGGYGNAASGQLASVSGGSDNSVSGSEASVSGGVSNTASGHFASVSGGQGCNTGATEAKWVVGNQAPGCSTTLGN